jgi:hypothetical protein
VRRAAIGAGAALLLGLGAWAAAQAFQNEAVPEETAAPDVAETPAGNDAAAVETPEPAATPERRAAVRQATPMRDRVAVIGLLNKRNGISRDLTLKPGQALRVGNAIVRLRACETTAPWEPQQLTGAFVQLDVQGRDGKWRRSFSGWLYKESPSLNVVEDSLYDAWPKSCTMRYPEIGADTVSVSSGRSSAKKSGPDEAEGEAAPPAPNTAVPEPTPSASSSSAT